MLLTARGVDLGGLCSPCRVEKERVRETEIASFVDSRGSGDCSLLAGLFMFEQRLRRNSQYFNFGLDLEDPPDHYDSGVTPANTVCFARIGLNDIHFSLVSSEGKVSDASSVVATYPRNDGSEFDCNFIVGDSLHDFLSLGSVAGFLPLSSLPFHFEEVAHELEFGPEADEYEAEALALLEEFRAELDLRPWRNTESRLRQLQARRRFVLKFKRKWWPW